jgi:hypothetical protein
MHCVIIFQNFPFRGFHSSPFLTHFSNHFHSHFVNSSAKVTKMNQKLDSKLAENRPKMSTVNDPNVFT